MRQRPRICNAHGFTLIELLIVVAIIAILAAIAVPNFLEAQTRSKVARAKADMRTLITGLESYYVDYNKFPDVPRSEVSPPGIKLGGVFSRRALILLSTPVSYLTNGQLSDPFARPGSTVTVTSLETDFFGYANAKAALPSPDLAAVGISANPDELGKWLEHGYVLQSVGPDTENYALAPGGFPKAFARLVHPEQTVGQDFIYDPTNGTISMGDIARTRILNFN